MFDYPCLLGTGSNGVIYSSAIVARTKFVVQSQGPTDITLGYGPGADGVTGGIVDDCSPTKDPGFNSPAYQASATATVLEALPDTDGDGFTDDVDNCIYEPNPVRNGLSRIRTIVAWPVKWVVDVSDRGFVSMNDVG